MEEAAGLRQSPTRDRGSHFGAAVAQARLCLLTRACHASALLSLTEPISYISVPFSFSSLPSASEAERALARSFRTLPWGIWVAQSVQWPALGFGSGQDLRVLGSSPPLGSSFSGESASGFSLFLCSSPCSLTHSLSLSKINL